MLAMDLRLPEGQEARTTRIASFNRWTLDASSVFVCTREDERPLIPLLERVVAYEAADPPMLQGYTYARKGSAKYIAWIQWWRLHRCWLLVNSDERLHGRRHDWYFKVRLDFELPNAPVGQLVSLLEERERHASLTRAVFMDTDRFIAGRHAAFDAAGQYYAHRTMYCPSWPRGSLCPYCQYWPVNYSLVAQSDPTVAQFVESVSALSGASAQSRPLFRRQHRLLGCYTARNQEAPSGDAIRRHSRSTHPGCTVPLAAVAAPSARLQLDGDPALAHLADNQTRFTTDWLSGGECAVRTCRHSTALRTPTRRASSTGLTSSASRQPKLRLALRLIFSSTCCAAT